MDEFAVFKRFNDVGQANELAELLASNGIEYRLVDDSPPVDITFTGDPLHKEAQLMIKQSDFEKANLILDKQAEETMADIDSDYYLFGFANEELYEILEKTDEWNAFDYKLAQKILRDRGEDINDALLKSLRQKRIAALAQPEKGQGLWILSGYFFSLFGGFLGIVIGWFLWKMKKTLPNGEKVLSHTATNRFHGKVIFVIGLIVFITVMVLRFVYSYTYY
ncbi:MAG: hypothetical protein A2W91_00230 [Bacteroidetes bacterium GWF2_38_335]|nr:MAG: hypothetical protein A2W91_00230 [Bacteroidetes bacterium GWF2_38_335]OFY78261.1 MAG: hypothetical protein A2281_03610 [Bacteroidetes bacterium RIFOXYA12_FULL_38_20]HBS87546.1 hypothetical protein [Bacteroidales bacterium]